MNLSHLEYFQLLLKILVSEMLSKLMEIAFKNITHKTAICCSHNYMADATNIPFSVFFRGRINFRGTKFLIIPNYIMK